tara:strand:- start:2730 stop:3077 length:348 start_codon:yes stop_codon:yes gene_type:complete
MSLNLQRKIDGADIRDAISELSGFSSAELADPQLRWNRKIASWRALGLYIGRERGLSYKDVANFFGVHGMTAYHSYKKVTYELATDETVSNLIKKIEYKIDNKHENDDREIQDSP